VAYFSETNTKLPEILSVSHVAKLSKKNNFLIATIENDAIQLRTLQEYLPIRYTKANHLA
jgi:hypothetical protein